MKQPTDMGMNRTGIGMAPRMKEGMIKNAEQFGAGDVNGAAHLADVRADYDKSSPPIGSMPPPSSAKGVLKSGMQMLQGKKPTVLLNKLGERLAFERSGTRLYEALLTKFDAEGSWDGGPTREQLKDFHDDEWRHFEMVHEALESLGSDPTTMTPAADVAGVASEGLVKVITDPRSSLAESMEAILIAELADHDGWEMLIGLTDILGQDELTSRFKGALKEEDEHLHWVRQWLSNYVTEQAGA